MLCYQVKQCQKKNCNMCCVFQLNKMHWNTVSNACKTDFNTFPFKAKLFMF